MKRVWMVLALCGLLTACGAEARNARPQDLQERYASAGSCEARVRVTVVRDDANEAYLLAAAHDGDKTRVTVLEPEELKDITATITNDKELSLSFDGMVLDAGSASEGVSALNAFDIFLRAVSEGYLTEHSAERFREEADAARLCFETDEDGETLLVTACFDAQDLPLYAEIERDGEILAYLEFTDFAFYDMISQDSPSE